MVFRWMILLVVFVGMLLGMVQCQQQRADDDEATITATSRSGTEESWPMQYPPEQVFYQKGSSEQIRWYQQYMQGCEDQFVVNVENDNDSSSRRRQKSMCYEKEMERIQINARQPRSVQNFTHAGYAKVSIPSETFRILQEFWQEQQQSSKKIMEPWDRENIYTNHWQSPPYTVPIQGTQDDDSYFFLSTDQRRFILTEIQAVLESWISSPLIPTSLYGIRVYGNQSILAPHVDRIPLIVSAILNIDQDVDVPWILQVIGHDGFAHNLTLQPGEMILYESHSIIHGRPYPMQGKYYANVFAHFEPVGFTPQFHKRRQQSVFDTEYNDEIAERFQKALDHWTKEDTPQDIQRRQQQNKALPHWIPEHSPQAARWRQEYVFHRVILKQEQEQKQKQHSDEQQHTKSSASSFLHPPAPRTAHTLAADGDLERLKELVRDDPGIVQEADANGWQPIHEAARSGNTEVLKYLIEEHNVEVNARTNNGDGATALWWAQHVLDPNHPAIQLLRRHGAVAVGPFAEVE